MKYKKLPYIVLSAAIILLDQLTKQLALTHLALNQFEGGRDITVIPGVFYLSFATNNGAAWSILSGQRAILLAVSVAALALIAFVIIRGWIDSKVGIIGIYFVLGGAIGNLIDRAFRAGGAVIDMFDFRLINFPIFNVADVFITVGGVLFGIFVLKSVFVSKKEDQQ